jgi:Holliday junction resolvase
MSAARKGADFERRVKRHLKRQGWCVIRAAGSRGPVDLVAIRRDGHGGSEVRLIQCKVGSPHFTLNDWSRLEQIALETGATAWLACRGPASEGYPIILKPSPQPARRPRCGGAYMMDGRPGGYPDTRRLSEDCV